MPRRSPRLLVLSALLLSATAVAIGSTTRSADPGGPYRPAPAALAQAGAAPSRMRWFKGNTHTHTINNGGDSTPNEVVTWYRTHGYQFLVLTDHNMLTKVDGLNAIFAVDDQFLVVQGEEVTSRSGDKPVHINGLDVKEKVTAVDSPSVAESLQRDIDGIRAAFGVPHINHPNFGWGITADELKQAKNYKLLEIHNGHPSVNNLGGGGVPGMEEVWDRLLSSGMTVYGMATDDAHVFKDPGNPLVSGPGRGWVMVRAARLDSQALMESLERGEFYSSTGVVLDEVTASQRDLGIKVKVDGSSKYRIQFFGTGGKLLREVTDPAATYSFKGDEGYVRAKVLESNGRVAWTQPVPVARPTSSARLWRAITSS